MKVIWQIATKKLTLLMPLSFASLAHAQAFYDAAAYRQMYSPVQRDDDQLFNLNPAAIATTGNKVGGYLFRRERSSTFILPDDATTTTKTDLQENGYGAGGVFDLGAGTAAGVTAERLYSNVAINVNTINNKPVERMLTQTLTGKVLIDLAPGFKIGLGLRFINERGDILGNASANINRDRVKYDGSLIGHGGGLHYGDEKFSVGAAYFPAARGKTEIISEERIITEPGVALIDARLKMDKNYFGLGVRRAVHRRDERAVSVTSEDGQRTLALDGISPDKNTFATQSIHGALEWGLTANAAVQLGVANHQREWLFDNSKVPGDSDSVDRYTFMEWQVGLHITAPIDVVAGYRVDSHETKLTSQSGGSRNGASYKAGGKILFATVAAKL